MASHVIIRTSSTLLRAFGAEYLMKSRKKRPLILILLLLGAAALAIFAAVELDADEVRACLDALRPGWAVMIVVCMLLYYLCDAMKYQIVTRVFGCAQPFGDSLLTTMLGFFYSAVTPLASGGQPFQVVHMHQRGVSTSTATSVICMVYALWKAALVTLGILGIFLCGKPLMALSAAWLPVLLLGLLIHLALLVLVILSAAFPQVMTRFGASCIMHVFGWRLLASHHPDAARWIEKWADFVQEYHDAFACGFRRPRAMLAAFALALAQCVAYMSVAYCTLRGFGLSGAPYYAVMLTQVLLHVGASFFPMPGASGASEGGFLLVYTQLFGPYLTMGMLIWRLATYYLTILLGYVAVIVERFSLKTGAEK